MKLSAYHGTLKEHEQSIKENGFNISTGDHQWFGDGVYFFQTIEPLTDGYTEAKNWVLYVKRHPQWIVFQACIESEYFIDLVSCQEHKKLFTEARKKAHALHQKSKYSARPFKEQAIYHILRNKFAPDFIRVIVNADKYSNYQYYSYTVNHCQIQVCVINTSCITNYQVC
jgi:hypothetical protein